jgi:transposase-like protein
MTKALYPHKDDIKAAILSGETYAAVAQRYGAFPPEVHALLRKDPDIVAAKASGALRARGRGKLTLEECLADPAVVDVVENGMSTVAAAKKHGISQPTLWVKVKRAKDLLNPPTPEPQAAPTPAPQPADPEIDAIKALVKAYAGRRQLTYAGALALLGESLPA